MTSLFVWSKVNDSKKDSNHSKDGKINLPQVREILVLQDKEVSGISSGQNHTLFCLKSGCVTYSCDHGTSIQEDSSESNTFSQLDPVQTLNDQKVQVIQVAVGSSHSVVLTKEHKVRIWGKNDNGQLGQHVKGKNRKRAKLLRSLANHCVLQISCGSDHTLALTDDGLVFAWGSNCYGQLGLGHNIQNLDYGSKEISCLRGVPVLQVTAGANHSFALSMSGTVYGWGKNNFGQLGLNNTEDCYTPKECTFLRDKNVRYICCGKNHSACLTKAGHVFTFGAGRSGQLGYSGNVKFLEPKLVEELSDNEVTQIACGNEHTLAYEPKSGRLFVFGFGGSEKLKQPATRESNQFATLKPFVLNSVKTSHFSMILDSSELKIKSIYAGGNQCFITTVSVNTCDSDDFRKVDATQHILTLSEERINKLQTLSSAFTLSDNFLIDVQKIFSSASCLNGSFLMPSQEDIDISNSHGLNMAAVRELFKNLKKTPEVMKCINTTINEYLTTNLPLQPQEFEPGPESMRLYLILPECQIFDQPEFYSSFICQFGKSFLHHERVKTVVSSWWSSEQEVFKRLVTVYRQCVQYLIQLPNSIIDSIVQRRHEQLMTALEMLKHLYQMNVTHSLVDESFFIVPELKHEVKFHDDSVLGLTMQGEQYCAYPFLFDDNETKVILFQIQAATLMQFAEILYTFSLFQANPYMCLEVNRDHLLHDTFSKLHSIPDTEYKKKLLVSFQGEPAGGDGVKKEFFRLLFHEIMDPQLNFFTSDEKSMLQWFSCLENPADYYLIGVLCGLMTYNSVAVNLNFPVAVYKKLLNKPVTFEDFNELKPIDGGNLQSMLDYDDGENFESTFDLTFVYGPTTEHELCPGGAEKVVSQENKKEYVDLYVDYVLNKSIKDQFDQFTRGFHSVCGGEVLNSFHPGNLRRMVQGNENYNFQEFQKYTIYEGGFCPRDRTIKFFWQVFQEMSLAEKKKFLSFLTGSDCIPTTGMKNINMTIGPLNRGEEYLPVVLTCHKKLLLPKYSTKEQLQSKLLMAIQQSGFRLKVTDDFD